MKQTEFRFSDIAPDCLIRYLLKHLWMIVASALIFAMAASLYVSLLYTPKYQASTTYAVSSRKTSYTYSGNISSAKEVAGVLAEMLQSDLAMEHIRSSDAALEDFSGTVTASQISGSNFIVIRVTGSSPKTAFLALMAIDGLLPNFTDYVASNSVVQVVRNPAVSAAPVNRVNSRSLSRQAALAGAALMAALLCCFFLREGTIQTRSAARHMLDTGIIATIYEENRRMGPIKYPLRKSRKPLHVFSPTTSFLYTEQINTICARMEHEAAARGSKVFLFTGVGENEGKTTIAGNVAAALSIMGKRVALLDCDLRNPSLNRFFDGMYTSGMPLNQMLSQPLTKDTLVHCIQRHERLGIFMLFPSGPDRRCAELLSGNTMDEVLKQLRIFDYVILDTPPAGYFAETEALAQKVDATMLVVRKNVSSAEDINDTVAMLRGASSSFLGCILNGMTHSVTEGYGYGNDYDYRYNYSYGQARSKKAAPSAKRKEAEHGKRSHT